MLAGSWDLGKWFGPIEVVGGEAVAVHEATEIVGLELGDKAMRPKFFPDILYGNFLLYR